MNKKILSIILSLAMLFTLCSPLASFAASPVPASIMISGPTTIKAPSQWNAKEVTEQFIATAKDKSGKTVALDQNKVTWTCTNANGKDIVKSNPGKCTFTGGTLTMLAGVRPDNGAKSEELFIKASYNAGGKIISGTATSSFVATELAGPFYFGIKFGATTIQSAVCVTRGSFPQSTGKPYQLKIPKEGTQYIALTSFVYDQYARPMNQARMRFYLSAPDGPGMNVVSFTKDAVSRSSEGPTGILTIPSNAEPGLYELSLFIPATSVQSVTTVVTSPGIETSVKTSSAIDYVTYGTDKKVTAQFELVRNASSNTGATDIGNEGKENAPGIKTFTDVDKTAWYYDSVQYTVTNGLMNGTSAKLFSPKTKATRAMLVSSLWNLDKKPQVNIPMPFSDVKSNAWYADAVRWAASLNVVDGMDKTHFAPDVPVTREQFASILYRYAKLKNKGFTDLWMTDLNYKDNDKISSWAYEAICWCTMNGTLKGDNSGNLNPQGLTTRAEAAAMLQRFCELGRWFK